MSSIKANTLAGAVVCIGLIVYICYHPIFFKHDWLKPSSALHSTLDNAMHSATNSPEQNRLLASAEDMILTQLSPGSPNTAVRQFIRENLPSAPESSASRATDAPYVCIKAMQEGSFPAGSSWVEIVFLLDPDNRLRSVSVYLAGTSL